jgi:hypothetical protein
MNGMKVKNKMIKRPFAIMKPKLRGSRVWPSQRSVGGDPAEEGDLVVKALFRKSMS